MKQLIFLYNELLDESYQKKLMLPLEFISFAYIEGVVLYEINQRHYAIKKNKNARHSKVFGALYILDSSEKYLRNLDASMSCSRGLIGRNHKLDEYHREYYEATPIHFKSIENFLKLDYNEGVPVRIITYIGNLENELIKAKVFNKSRNRITCGFDINNFINLVLEKEK